MSNTTRIIIPTQGVANSIDGLWDANQIKTMYAAQINGLSAMTGTATDEVTAEGTVRTITFSPQTGNKGAGV